MEKFFDYLEADLSLPAMRKLLQYICRFVRTMGGDIPVEGRVGKVGFCAARAEEAIRIYWVQIGRRRIAVDAWV